MSDEPPLCQLENATPADFHREIANELFHLVLGLMAREDRTCAENDRMVHAAHASRFHYDFAGAPVNLSLGEWQCARVHTLVRQPDAALHHAWNALEIAENYSLGDFQVALAHTALAGAFGLNKPPEAAKHLEKARVLREGVLEEEQRTLLTNELAALEKELPTAAAKT